jgi:osmotically-inducible protein OsmY
MVCLLVGYYLPAKKQPLPDDLIVDQIRTKVVADAVVKGGALVVPVSDGVVTLSGTMETPQAKTHGRHTIAKQG